MSTHNEPILIKMSDVPRKQLQWVWKRFPIGGLTLIVGDPGVGKSFAIYDFVAKMTRGLPLFDDDESATRKPQTTLIMFECNAETSVRPRLENMGADLEKIHWLQGLKGKTEGSKVRFTACEVNDA